MSVTFKPEAHNPVWHERTTSYNPGDGFPLHSNRFKYGVSFYNWSTLFVYFFTRHEVKGWMEEWVEECHSVKLYLSLFFQG